MRRNPRTAPLLWLVVVVAAGLSSLIGPRPAAACGNVVLSEEARVARVQKADKLLRVGHHKRAARLVRSLFTFIRLPPKQSYRPLFFPAQRILANAVVRSHGAVRYHGAKTREQNLSWARERLADHHQMWPDDPEITASYAAALVPTRPAQARALLEKLDGGDVLPSADGYAALATLAAGSREPIFFAYALVRCHAMAGDAGTRICHRGVTSAR